MRVCLMFLNEIKKLDCELKLDRPLSDFCTFRIGGRAKYIIVVYDNDTLLKVCHICILHHIKYKIIGLGANLLFSDKGYNGAIIITKAKKIYRKNTAIYVDSGTTIGELIQYCYQNDLSGLEAFSGIPSTLGGAIVNSLGAFDTNISDMVDYVICYKKDDMLKKKNSFGSFGSATVSTSKVNIMIGFIILIFGAIAFMRHAYILIKRNFLHDFPEFRNLLLYITIVAFSGGVGWIIWQFLKHVPYKAEKDHARKDQGK